MKLTEALGISKEQLVCYTYGAPRIGNHAYKQLSLERVPDMWHIVNDQDVVSKALKLGGLYKRCGHRVIISKSGRLVVRPSFFEFLLLQVGFPYKLMVSLCYCGDCAFA